MVCCPPFNPAWITAEPALASWSPAWPERLPAVGTYLLRPLLCPPPLQCFLLVILYAALVATKPSALAPLSALLHGSSTFWADIQWHVIAALCVVVFVPALIAAEFLPCDVAGRNKPISTVQADSFFGHLDSPFAPVYHRTKGTPPFYAYKYL